jgi:flagellar biosynthesis protein FliR
MGGIEGIEGELRYGAAHVVRILAALGILPAFGSGPASRFAKVGLAVMLGVIVATARDHRGWVDPGPDPGALALLGLREMLFGLLLGWVARFWLEACRLAGGLISHEMGLNIANQLDPSSGQSIPLVGYLYETVALVLFFGMHAHHAVIGALVRSFDGVPPGRFTVDDRVLGALVSFGSGMIEASIRLAAPVFIVLVLVSLMIGLMSRVAPQWHLLDTAYPIRAGVALILIVLTFPMIRPFIEQLFETSNRELEALVAGP